MSKITTSNPVEGIKAASNFLRGTLRESLLDGATGTISEDDTQLSKFHGIYQQDDRDKRENRRRQKLEPDHSFMIRARVPGGVCTPQQWLALDAIATRWANHSLRLTTRQAFQFHGVLKRDLKASIRAINDSLMDTIAACGDVNRNVMCTSLPELSKLHSEVYAVSASLSEHLTPNTRAYHEIWLDKEKVIDSQDVEPIYGDIYLPRKFKIAFAIPPNNDVDVQAHDLGFIATSDDGLLTGFTITVGGGMGATHGDPATYPVLAKVMGWCTPEQVNEVAEAIVTIQRDFGDRSNRRHARFKYTLEDRGLPWLREELERRLGYQVGPAQAYVFTKNGDDFGWKQSDDGAWHLLLFTENGRLADTDRASQLTGMRKIATVHSGDFRLTPNQNVVIANVDASQKPAIDALVEQHGLDSYKQLSRLRLHSMACVALPTCGQAMAEAERYMPDLLGKIETLLIQHNLQDQPITIRMTGCPNGCARPYLAEIGLVGKAPGRFNLHLGAAFDGTRLNRMILENADENTILGTLDHLFERYGKLESRDLYFGDWFVSTGQMARGGEVQNAST
jgi:sulfite reductase (NADPH) hemoprotein beta-component